MTTPSTHVPGPRRRVRLLVAAALASAAALTTGALGATTAVSAASSDAPVVAIDPVRLLDTRSGAETVDGQFAGGGAVSAGGTVRVQVGGRAGIPEGAVAVVANVTVVNPGGRGHATVHPCGDVPNASTLNYTAGRTVANSTFAGLDATGGLCVTTHAQAHLLVDVTAYLANTDQWRPLEPARLFDSRPAGRTVDGQFQALGPPMAGSSVQIWGRGGVSANEGEPVGAVALNVTAVAPDAAGYVRLRPCSATTGTSTVNFTAGQTVANGIVVPTDIHGRVCIDTVGHPDVIIDVVAVDPTLANATDHAELEALTPARVLDTRPGGETVDGEGSGSGRTAAGGVTHVRIAGRAGVPDDADAVLVNLTVAAADGAGHATVFPCTDEVPNASTSNVLDATPVANTALARLSPQGEICIATHMSAHLVVDVLAAIYVNPTP